MTPPTTPAGRNGTPSEIEADIARQREELAATVGELQARLDVKTRTKERVAQQPVLFAAGAAGVVVLVGVLVHLRRR